MEFTGERFVPTETINPRLALEHWHRYLWASEFVANKNVLDIACGEGFGSNFLAKRAKSVLGADISEQTVLHAQNKYKQDNVEFRQMSADSIGLEDKSMDVVVSFETIEHVDASTQEKAIKEFSRVLKDDGLLFITTPGIKSPLHCKYNEFHIKECSYEEFEALLSKQFKYVRIIGQSIYNASAIGDSEIGAKVLSRKFDKYDQAHEHDVQLDKYLVAVCSNTAIDELGLSSVLVDRRIILPVNEPEKDKELNVLGILVCLFKVFMYSLRAKTASEEKAKKYTEKKVKYLNKLM